MDLILSRYRKPKGRPTKRRKMLAANSKKRWQISPETVDERNSNSMILQRKPLSELNTFPNLRQAIFSPTRLYFLNYCRKFLVNIVQTVPLL
ncbi:hypothetical protein TNCV_29121 [Trichonephila clavipes]|nr:hypothetical protein TNCV_29121 [Trichonephila clavipes]